jgi:pimeloyl-ACP methyl ester carboxylesterase
MHPRAAPEIVDFAARDGFKLNLHHYPAKGNAGGAEPVILLHGAGVRSGIFLPPADETIVDALLGAGYDVWLLNWRASIDLPPNEWTLEDAAVHDHPAAVRTVLDRTGAKSVKAVIHCQGSTSFMMSLVAGLLPDVSLVVSNAVALHPMVPRLSRLKSRYMTNTAGALVTYLNPQWGLSAPAGWPTVFDWFVRATHHECNNAVCKHSSFTFGAGFPTLWLHENLDEATHEWLKGEFAHVPMTFFHEMQRCIEAGRLVSSGKYPELPASFVAQAPRTDARFAFLGGQFNHCFVPESQQRTLDFFDRHAPGRNAFYEIAGYGHLDVFIGKNAARDNFPLIIDELGKGGARAGRKG